MNIRLVIRPEAERDIQEAYLWYEKRREGLGEDFLLCVEEGLSKIMRSPHMYPVVYRGVRRLLVRRFPYGIFYVIREELISVLAVLHGHRDPDRWRQRATHEVRGDPKTT
ncbi:Plasmid stabilization system protein ParE [Desulfacinum infernum DSM 9756]|uniref:Plasmid stabilization system protein ParE n=1 Tax=Desulfacinum infernum DSM 9756 TaxID=1121391 RepID=A0A1M4X7M0_9BACT|nr:type II toxin-antitoxin system RelE/ParE family toxin [Desulfacinum infernum]SHE89457.1 Plasmid stabilization system protein ParE [Desulfacinum infernum DSM 9756]